MASASQLVCFLEELGYECSLLVPVDAPARRRSALLREEAVGCVAVESREQEQARARRVSKTASRTTSQLDLGGGPLPVAHLPGRAPNPAKSPAAPVPYSTKPRHSPIDAGASSSSPSIFAHLIPGCFFFILISILAGLALCEDPATSTACVRGSRSKRTSAPVGRWTARETCVGVSGRELWDGARSVRSALGYLL